MGNCWTRPSPTHGLAMHCHWGNPFHTPLCLDLSPRSRHPPLFFIFCSLDLGQLNRGQIHQAGSKLWKKNELHFNLFLWQSDNIIHVYAPAFATVLLFDLGEVTSSFQAFISPPNLCLDQYLWEEKCLVLCVCIVAKPGGPSPGTWALQFRHRKPLWSLGYEIQVTTADRDPSQKWQSSPSLQQDLALLRQKLSQTFQLLLSNLKYLKWGIRCPPLPLDTTKNKRGKNFH